MRMKQEKDKTKINIFSTATAIMTYFLQPLLFAVAQECPKQAAVQVVQDGDQEVLVELKSCRKLQAKQLH